VGGGREEGGTDRDRRSRGLAKISVFRGDRRDLTEFEGVDAGAGGGGELESCVFGGEGHDDLEDGVRRWECI
jgi:hypothetical protein